MIVVKEVVHILTKAYDSLEWAFIKDTLINYNFPIKVIDLIMCCITTPNFFGALEWRDNSRVCTK